MAKRREPDRLYDIWKRCNTDRKLQEQFASVMKIKAKPGAYASIYTPEIMYLFRYNTILEIMSDRAAVVAEALHLIHRAKYQRNARQPSNYLCIVTPEAGVLIRTEDLKDYFLISKTPDYDWDLEPANPDERLISDLRKVPAVRQLFVYHWQYPAEEKAFLDRLALCQAEEQLTIFSYDEQVRELPEKNVQPEGEGELTEKTEIEKKKTQKKADIQKSVDTKEERKEEIKEETGFGCSGIKDTKNIEDLYLDRVMGRPVDESRLQLTGAFYTPLPFAEKAIVYLGRVIGPKWWTTGKYRLWDMAAGTGNMEYVLPPEAQRYCYMSTLSEEETAYCRKMFPGAVVFQYDYLNDDVDFMEYAGLEAMGIRKKLPDRLQEELRNPGLRWVILLNPPYSGERESEDPAIQREQADCEAPFLRTEKPAKATGTADREQNLWMEERGGRSLPISYGKRTWATTTKIQQLMTAEGLGRASRDLSSQFLYRIHREFAGREAYLGLLSRLGYLTAAHNEGIRDVFFRYRYEKGFLFSSMNFKGCKHKFPYGFLLWNLKYQMPLEEQEILADIYNRAVEKIDTVRIVPGKALPPL